MKEGADDEERGREREEEEEQEREAEAALDGRSASLSLTCLSLTCLPPSPPSFPPGVSRSCRLLLQFLSSGSNNVVHQLRLGQNARHPAQQAALLVRKQQQKQQRTRRKCHFESDIFPASSSTLCVFSARNAALPRGVSALVVCVFSEQLMVVNPDEMRHESSYVSLERQCWWFNGSVGECFCWCWISGGCCAGNVQKGGDFAPIDLSCVRVHVYVHVSPSVPIFLMQWH